MTSPALPAAAAGTITLGLDLVVNRMGYGAMRLTGPGIWGPPHYRREAIRVLRRAIELGVNFIDTAAAYGPYASEELIAEALCPYPDDLVIATKGGMERPGPDQWVPNGRPEYLRRDVEGSLQRLRLERIDLWQLHRIDPKVPALEQFDAMHEFQREGLVHHLGLCEASVDDALVARGRITIVSMQNRYNVGDREWEPVVDFCDREGLAMLPWYPLAAGGLDEDVDRPLDRVAKRHGCTVYQIALAWLLDRSPQILVIPGTSSVAHLEENVAAGDIRLTDEDREELDELAG